METSESEDSARVANRSASEVPAAVLPTWLKARCGKMPQSANVSGYGSFSVMRRVVFTGRLVLLWTLTVATFANAQQSRPAAYVLDITGTWQLEGQKEAVKAGQPLDAGSRLSTAADNYDNSITIMRRDDLSRTRIACEDSPSNPCQKPVVINPASSSPSTDHSKSLIVAALAVLLNKPPAVTSHFSATLSRGEYVVIEKEDVLSMDNGENGPSLTASFPALPPGRYTVLATKDDGTTLVSEEKVVHLADGSWQPLNVPAPGLYMVSITASDGERRADLLLLFVPKADYRAAREQFDAVRNRTSQWKGPNAQADEHILLRAVLLAMSPPS